MSRNKILDLDQYLFFKAAKECNAIDLSFRIARKNVSVNIRDVNGMTPLMLAACGRQNGVECLTMLLKAGADVNAKHFLNDQTALMVALLHRDLKAVRLLVKHGAFVNTKNTDGTTPLMMAVATGKIEFVKVILDAGAELEVKDANGRTALFHSITSNDIPVVRTLLQRGANVNTRSHDGRTLLMKAFNCKTVCLANLLLQAGIEVNQGDSTGRTPLMYAARNKCQPVETLISLVRKNGADVNAVTVDGETALTFAFKTLCGGFHRNVSFFNDLNKESHKKISILLSLGADLNQCRANQKYLHRMLWAKKDDILQKMITNGCAPREVSWLSARQEETNGFISPLELAICLNHPDAARFLLANRFLTKSDVNELPQRLHRCRIDTSQQLSKEETGWCSEETVACFFSIVDQPFSLKTLSFVAVSSALEQEDQRFVDDGDSSYLAFSDCEEDCWQFYSDLGYDKQSRRSDKKNKKSVKDNQTEHQSRSDGSGPQPQRPDRDGSGGLSSCAQLERAASSGQASCSNLVRAGLSGQSFSKNPGKKRLQNGQVSHENLHQRGLRSSSSSRAANMKGQGYVEGRSRNAASESSADDSCLLPFKRRKHTLKLEDESTAQIELPKHLTRREKVELLPLPPYLEKCLIVFPESFKDALLFRSPTAFTDRERWGDLDTDNLI